MRRGARLALVFTCGLLAGHVGGSYGVESFDLTLHWNVYVSAGFPPVSELLAAPVRVPLKMPEFQAAWWVAYLIAFVLSLTIVVTIVLRATRSHRSPYGFAVKSPQSPPRGNDR